MKKHSYGKKDQTFFINYAGAMETIERLVALEGSEDNPYIDKQ